MAEVITMPRLSDTMTEGVVAKWHKKPGDKVKSGELLAEIETDKATMEFESFFDGVLLHIVAEEGKPVQVDAPIAVIGKEGEDYQQVLASHSKHTQSNRSESAEVSQAKASATPPNIAMPDLSSIKAKAIRMPRLSDTMTEGVVARWHKKVGDKVKAGELLAEIETDKATMEFESFETGHLLYIGVKEGERAPVDAILAIIGDPEADYTKILEAEKRPVPDNAQFQQVSQKPRQENHSGMTSDIAVLPSVMTEVKNTPAATFAASDRVKASPLAKKLAKERGIDLRYLKGSGHEGRIVKRDIDQYKGTGFAPASVRAEKYVDIPVSQMRKTIARRLSESKFSAPHFYLTMEIDMDATVQARNKINEISPVKISFNDIVIKAVARALRKHPQVNASWMGDFIRRYEHIHIGVAVAVEEGLLVPVIRFADTKRLSQIAAEVKVFAEKARNKQLQPEDWQGNTFTISNLGMYGIEEFTAIINPPDACILAVGGVIQKPVVKNHQIIPGYVMKVTMSCDHRVVDGATGAAFLQTLKNYLENPFLLLGEDSL